MSKLKKVSEGVHEYTGKIVLNDINFASVSSTYANILLHRRKCPLWAKSFCLDCFGGGLTQFTRDLQREGIVK